MFNTQNAKPERKVLIVKNNTLSNGTSATLYTTPNTTQNFYLVAAQLNIHKDAGNGATLETMAASVASGSVDIIRIASLASTADSQVISVSFPIPIKIDANSNIVITANSGTNNIRMGGMVAGYLE